MARNMAQGSDIFVQFRSTQRKVAYTDSGHGDAIVFLHGWNHSSHVWHEVTEHLVTSYRCLAFDLPGFGRTEPLDRVDISIRSYAEVCANVVRGLLGTATPCGIVGDSFGALVAMRIVGDGMLPACPLVLSGCPSEGLAPALRLLAHTRGVYVALSLLKRMPLPLAHRILSYLSLATVRSRHHISEALIESVLQADPATSQGVFETMLRMPEMNAGMGQYPCKVLVVRGEYDRIVGRETAERLARRFNTVLHEIPGVGHTPMIENPQSYARSIQDLLLTGHPIKE